MVGILEIVYLIVSGTVNCIGDRGISFKKYVKGSFVGDLEIFSNSPRYFSVKAQVSTTVLVISKANLERVFQAYPECREIIYRRSLERMLKCDISLARIKCFDKMSQTDKFWRKNTTQSQDKLHLQVIDFLDNFANIHDQLSSE